MPYYIRVLQSKRHWDDSSIGLEWLESGELPADSLSNVVTTNNALSIYMLDDAGENRDKILCGYAATRDNIAYIDYIVFSGDVLHEIKLSLAETLGETPIEEINKLHRDVINISANKLIDMIKASLEGGWMMRLTKSKVKKLVKEEVNKGTIKIDALREGVKKNILL